MIIFKEILFRSSFYIEQKLIIFTPVFNELFIWLALAFAIGML